MQILAEKFVSLRTRKFMQTLADAVTYKMALEIHVVSSYVRKGQHVYK